MTRKNSSKGSPGGGPKKIPVGVWNRGMGRGPASPIRVRTKRLDQIDGDKIALAYWLLAKQIVEDGTGLSITEEETRRVAGEIDNPDGVAEKLSPDEPGGRS